jgi:hypothetical protein
VRGDLFFLGQSILLHDEEILIGGRNIFGNMKGCTIEDGSGHVLNVQLDDPNLDAIP